MQKGFKISTKLIVTVSSLISICLVSFIAITANYYITRMSENNNALYDAYKVSEQIKTFRANMVSLNGNQERYMLTGNARNLEQYQINETQIKTLLKSIEKYFDNKAEEKTFDRLKDLTYKKLVEAKELKHNPGFGVNGTSGLNNNSNTLNQINEVIEELTSIVSAHTQLLIDNSVEYLSVSKKWNILEIALGIVVALAGVIILFRDINLRNQLENELRNAKKQAEENANIKEQFMANVSHEIRTPMNAILGFSELMNKTPLNEKQSEYLNAISSSSSNLLNIINDILDFSKIEAGKLQIEKIPFHLPNTLQALQTMFDQKAREKGLEFNVQTEQQIPTYIFGDPTRLNQILINLLGNAIKFTSKGSVTLNCELKGIEHDVAQLVFRVKDTGIGIPTDKLNDIFERFNQGNKETTRNFGGTGLGLSIVKSLVEIQNGQIYVKSKQGFGSEFVVTLSYPVSYQNAEVTKKENQPLAKLNSHNQKVLLVEDNLLNQKLAASYLEGFGLRTDIANNGELALEMLLNNTYKLVLMDIQMPVLDGYHTTEKIRNDLKLSLPVVAMTAHVIEGEIEKCYHYGMNDYISKPFREIDLHKLLRKYIDTEKDSNDSGSNYQEINTTNNNLKIVNINELKDLSRGNNNFIVEMIDIFLEQNPADIHEIEKAIAENNPEQIKTTAHRMKTSVGFMGMQVLVEPLNEMELLAEKKEKPERIKHLFENVNRDCTKANEELKEIKNTLTAK